MVPNVTRKRSSDCSKLCSSGGNIGGRRRGWSQSHLVELRKGAQNAPIPSLIPAHDQPPLPRSSPQAVHNSAQSASMCAPPTPTPLLHGSFMAVFIHLLVLPVITVTTLNSCVSLGYAVQGEVGLPGDPGQPMVNGAVEFLGFPKGHKGTQVCRCSVKTSRNPISSQSAPPPQTRSAPSLLPETISNIVPSSLKSSTATQQVFILRDLCLTFSGQIRAPGTTRKDIGIFGGCSIVCAQFHFFSGKGQPGPKGLRGFPGLTGRPVGFSFFL